ncbi:protein YohO [Enterobacter hormaechei]|nr:protein YohO [Enterobacter hormaechei]
MKATKLAVITLFALMAVSGIGGVMLAGYSFIVRGGVGLGIRPGVQTGDPPQSPPAQPEPPPE